MSPSTARTAGEFASEIKFLVSPDHAAELCRWAAANLEPDPHAGPDGRYRITSLYTDTAAFDVFSRRGSFARGKYRVRRYGNAAEAFVERKLKTSDRVAKIRSQIALDELPWLANRPVPGWSGYWFQRRLAARCLSPVCQISYQRTAYAAMTPNGPIRLTVDDDIRALPVSSFQFSRERGLEVLADVRVVEMKFRGDLPSRFKQAAERFLLTPTASSKYRHAVTALGIGEPAWATS
ncbi:MAG: polyphosphate polymerase domain-containing protein [Bryobacteraceae bacterium]